MRFVRLQCGTPRYLRREEEGDEGGRRREEEGIHFAFMISVHQPKKLPS